MTNKAFSRRMLDSKKRTGSGTHSYKWKYHPTPWKLFMDAVTKPQETILPRFGSKRFVLAIVALAVIIGGVVLAQGPLFHNIIHNPNAIEDPVTWLWRASAPTGANLDEFNQIQALSFQVGNNRTIFLQPNSTTTAVALTKVSTDFSVLSGKQLYGLFSWNINTNCCVNEHWGVYLTTNGTLPTQHSYNPYNDPSVSLLLLNQNTGGNNFAENLYLKRGETQSIASGDTGGCSPSSTCFLSLGFSNTTTTMQQPKSVIQEFILNFTGSTNAGTSCNALGSGNNCSTMGINNFRHGTQSVNVTTQLSPWFNFQAKSYFVGFYFLFGNSNGPVSFQFDTGNFGSSCSNSNGNTGQACMELNLAIQSPTVAVAPPNIDTGGWFGPIIRALISIGVFIAQNIINFLAFLAGVVFPVLATVFGVLVNALVGALNAIGNFFGLGNIGTTIQSFFTAIGNFLVNGVAAVIAQIANAVSFFVNGTTAFVNIAGTYWIKITSFFTAVGNLLSIIGTVFNDLLVLGAFSGNLALFMDWTWGMYKTYDEGTEGFHRWLDFNENVFLRVGKLAYFLSDHLFTTILRVKQLIVQWV